MNVEDILVIFIYFKSPNLDQSNIRPKLDLDTKSQNQKDRHNVGSTSTRWVWGRILLGKP
jgi:hypothetical protein